MVNVRATSEISTRVNRNKPIEVDNTRPANSPVRLSKAHAPIRAVSQHNNMVINAIGRRAATSDIPKILNAHAINQYFSGGFSKYLMPSRCGVTQSPVRSIVREMVACTESTSSMSEGGLTMQSR